MITEQPKILDGVIVNDNSFSKLCDTSKTVVAMKDLFGEDFVDSIKNKNGMFYWTHHTKCPHPKREPRDKCASRFLKTELQSFPNLKIVITLGGKATESIVKCCNAKKINVAESLFSLLRELCGRNVERITIDISNKQVLFLPLPHPSPANPLNYFLNKIAPIAKDYIYR